MLGTGTQAVMLEQSALYTLSHFRSRHSVSVYSSIPYNRSHGVLEVKALVSGDGWACLWMLLLTSGFLLPTIQGEKSPACISISACTRNVKRHSLEVGIFIRTLSETNIVQCL